jgi:hypothetical protein
LEACQDQQPHTDETDCSWASAVTAF